VLITGKSFFYLPLPVKMLPVTGKLEGFLNYTISQDFT
jgi:hypothetical protein